MKVFILESGPNEFDVRLTVDPQEFVIGPSWGTYDEAKWYSKEFKKALYKIVTPQHQHELFPTGLPIQENSRES